MVLWSPDIFRRARNLRVQKLWEADGFFVFRTHRDPRVVRDDPVVEGLDRLGVGLHPAQL